MLELLRARSQHTDFSTRLAAPANKPLPPRIRPRQQASAEAAQGLWAQLREHGSASEEDEAAIADPASLELAEGYSRNIESFIGTVKMPLGVVGPLRINGINAHGDYYVPLATTEAALVASYGRGADITARAGGITSAMIGEGVLRTPAFVFADMLEAGQFINWVAASAELLQSAAEATTRHGKLITIEPFMDSDTVFLICRYTTGDAAGQNMVTVATEALCSFIAEHTPIKPRHAFIEGNFSGDKKASYLGLHMGRGRKVTASIELPDVLIRKFLHVEPEAMLAYGRVAALGSTLSGQLGAQAHYANGLAAFYIATGQDAACVAESAVGFTRAEKRDGSVFFSVTMPNIVVGSVGGGTGLPSQSAALGIMGLKGAGKASAIAEVVGALCLCGEISIIAAIAAGHFTRAHAKLARLR
ncbi:hydroxymethylglutaryl-CoA reductase [Devosia sp. 2618]|uniref:hydroxymethylglutaryl-CoA reductase n=1 Tax=Devosia sp. 2618 TaxID=3156454 RepID=UPI0033975D4B